MIIKDLEHLELVSQANEVQGARLPINPRDVIGNAFSNFTNDVFVFGELGALSVGENNILTTATIDGFVAGHVSTYSSLAVGFVPRRRR